MTTALAVIIDITVVMALALLICRLLHRQPAALRHMVLVAALVAAAAVPLLEVALPRWEIAVLPGASQVATSGLTLSDESPRGGGLVDVSHVADAPLFTSSEMFLVIWALGFLVVMTRLLTGLARLVAMTRRCRTVQSSSWREHASSLAAEFDLRPVVVLESHDRVPLLTWGMFRPRIIVPAGAAAWTAGRIEAVLAHELAHIARRDWALQIATQIVCAVYWFNPLVWMTCRRLRNESEQACDDAVLRRGIDPADYATHLLAVARQVHAGGPRWASAPAILNSSSLERRIAAMLKPSCSREALTGTASLLALLVAFVVAAPVAALTLTRQVESMPVRAIAGRDVVLPAPAPAPAAQNAVHAPSNERRPVVRRDAPRPVARVPAAADAAAAAAQAAASLSGVLRDASGAVLPGVELTLRNSVDQTSSKAISDGTGRFTFRGIPEGRYELTARLPGFRTLMNNVILSAGDDQQISLMMQVGALSETVAVTCAGGAAALPRSAGVASLSIRRSMATPLFALPQAGQSLPVRVGGQIAAPRQISRVTPTCPGTPPGGGYVVILEATIGVDGLIRDIVSLRPKPADAQTAPFMQAAIDAVRQWQYTPTRLNNVPTPVIMTVTVSFSSN
jgi:beta-lactamase regulating signal transducer with metallopeptidase domain